MPIAPLLLLSAVVLAFEVFLTKLVSYTVEVLLVYVVLGMAMLGSGAAGSLVAVRRGWLSRERAPRVLAAAAIAFTWTLVLAPGAFVRVSPVTTRAPTAFALATLLTLPFLAAGVAITVALSAHGKSVGRVYAANLLGAAAGCFLPLALLGPLDGASFLALLASLAWLAATLYLREGGLLRERRYAIAHGAAFVLTLAALVAPQRVFPIQPDPNGQAAQLARVSAPFGIQTKQVFSRWGPVGHIAVFEFENVPGGPSPYPFMFYAQDGTAGSMLARWDGRDAAAVAGDPKGAPRSEITRFCTDTIYAQGYARPRDKVMVIGLGGAPDVQCALYHRARSVEVVEINPTTIAAMTGPFDAFLGGVGHDPRVTYHAKDGRSVARASRDAGYDLVQLSAVDTKSLLASGALALSENHLYTLEAFDDYLASLSPRGVLSIIRFGEPELMRVINTAAKALERRGVADPSRHIMAFVEGPIVGALIAREPFDDATIEATRAHFDFRAHRFEGIAPFFYDVLLPAMRTPPQIAWDPKHLGRPPYAPYFAALSRHEVKRFQASYPFDVSPTTDDRPFFFDLYIEASESAQVPFRVIYTLLGTVFALSLALILGPALWLRAKTGATAPAVAPWYFAAVGLAYLFVEVWLLHRFGMYLGHQTYGMSVVLAPLLTGTGIGAWLGERRIPDPPRRVRVGVGAIVVLVLAGWFLSPAVLGATWGWPIFARAALVVAYVGLLGVAMGLPFPAGLRWLGEQRPEALPWCIGINSFASVIASVAVTPLAVKWGYGLIFGAGLALYVGAALLSEWFAPDEEEAQAETEPAAQ
jgi:hypothetical protein